MATSFDLMVRKFVKRAGAVITGSLSMGRKASTTKGTGSTALGYDAEASGAYSQAFGQMTKASGTAAQAQGISGTASGNASHTEGGYNTGSGNYSHAEGYSSESSGEGSHAEGYGCVSSGQYSHAEGHGTTANHYAQHVGGEYNTPDPSTAAATARGIYAEIIGNGTANNARSNARTLDWDGNEKVAGDMIANAFADNPVSLMEVSDMTTHLKSVNGKPPRVMLKGEYIIHEGELCKLTTAVLTNTDIVVGPGGNAEKTFVTRELGTLSDHLVQHGTLIKEEFFSETGSKTVDCTGWRYILVYVLGNNDNFRTFLFPVLSSLPVSQYVAIDATASIWVHVLFRMDFNSKTLTVNAISSQTWTGANFKVYGINT